jgi:hypothetical protein
MAKSKTDNAFKLIQLVGDYPADLYRIPTDGRKWKRLCQDRALLVGKLARYGDPDGTTIRPAIETIRKQLCWSERKLFYVLDSLQEHGVLANEPHYHGMRGTRVRRLDIDMLTSHAPAKGYGAGLQHTKNLPVAGLQDTGAGLQDTPSRTASLASRTATLGCTQPPTHPHNPPPPPPSAQTPVAGGQAGAVVLDLQRAYQQSTGKILPVGGKGVKAKLSAIVSPYSPATVASAVERWVAMRTAPASGLRSPAIFLFDELPDLLAQTDAAEKAAAKLAAAMPELLARAAEMTEQYLAWVKQLDEFVSAATAKYLAGEYPPHETVIEAAVDAWVAANPAPTTGYWEVNDAGQLFSIDNVNDKVQAVKSQIAVATEQMGAEQTTE